MNIVDCYKVCLLVRLVSWSEAPREMLDRDLEEGEDQEDDLHQEDLHPGDPKCNMIIF